MPLSFRVYQDSVYMLNDTIYCGYPIRLIYSDQISAQEVGGMTQLMDKSRQNATIGQHILLVHVLLSSGLLIL